MSCENRRECSAYWAHTMGLTTVLKQKSLQSQPLLVVAESWTPCGEQWISAEAWSFRGIKIWKDNESHSVLHEKKSYSGRYRYFSHPSLMLAYCSKDIGEMSSMSHGSKCQAWWGGIGCIICLLLAPIWMPGEELCHPSFPRGTVDLFLSEQYKVALPDLNIIKILSKNNYK